MVPIPRHRAAAPPSERHDIVERLTTRELEVLERVAAGYRNREIAQALDVSIKTVEFHLGNIHSKLGVRSRTLAVVRAVQLGQLRLGRRA